MLHLIRCFRCESEGLTWVVSKLKETATCQHIVLLRAASLHIAVGYSLEDLGASASEQQVAEELPVHCHAVLQEFQMNV